MTTTPEGRFDAIRNRGVAVAVLIAAATVLLIGSLAPADASAATKWLCKPGVKPDPCKGSLKTTVFDSAGNSEVRTAKNAHRPKYDCFYVYPTVSGQPTPNANKDIDPEQTSIAQYQAARYSEDCKVYAPVYRQATLAGISDPENVDPNTFVIAYKDVLAAWKNYLRNYNKGRGVVLIGHSQGAGMLSQLLSSEIEKHRSQRKRLISAILLGGNVTIRKGKDLGGTFKKTPSLPLRQAGRLRDRVLDLQRDPTGQRALRPHRAARSRRCRPARTRPTTRSPAPTRPTSAAAPARSRRSLAASPSRARSESGITIMYGGPAPIGRHAVDHPAGSLHRQVRLHRRRQLADALVGRRREGAHPVPDPGLGPAPARRQRRPREPDRHRPLPGQAVPEAALDPGAQGRVRGPAKRAGPRTCAATLPRWRRYAPLVPCCSCRA